MTLFAWARVLWVSEWTMDMQKNEHGWSCKQSENCGSEGVQANGRFQLPSSLHVNFTRLFYTIFTYSALSRLSIFLPYRWEKVVLFLPDLFFLFSFLFSFFFFFFRFCRWCFWCQKPKTLEPKTTCQSNRTQVWWRVMDRQCLYFMLPKSEMLCFHYNFCCSILHETKPGSDDWLVK